MRVVLSEQAIRTELAREWWFRAWAERDSTARFARLHETLCQQGAPSSVCTAAKQASEDEERHAILCADLARTLDEDDPFATRPAKGEPIGPSDLSPGDALLYELTAFCCVTESMNAALLMSIHATTAEGPIRDATHQLLTDEVQHAKLGWAFLAWHTAERSSPAFFGTHLPAVLQAAASENLTEQDRFCATWSDPSRGYLSREQRVAIFCQCISDVIVPGLKRYGVATDDALQWVTQQDWTRAQAPT